MVKNDQFIKEFSVDTSGLSENEKEVLEKLIAAAKLVAPIYKLQINDKYQGANFYPPKVKKEEIEKAAKNDLGILDPYSVVEKKGNKLYSVPFHQKYRQNLLPLALLLKEAAKITDNHDFARRLVMQSNALLDGDYEAADIYWLTMKPYKIDVIIAPQERYEDRLFFIKNCYTAVVGIMDEEKTKYAHKIKDLILSTQKKTLFPAERVEFLDKMQLRADKVVVAAGLDARSAFTAADFPNDPDLMEKHGAQLIIFDNILDDRFDKDFYPIFKRVFAKEFQAEYKEELLREASFHYLLLHEIGHTLLRYKDAEIRLKEFFPVVDELAANVLGIKVFGSLLLKDAVSQKQLEALMVIFICRCFSWWISLSDKKSIESFAKGHAIALNYLFESGAIQESDGISWPNFTKMFLAFDELFSALERLLAFGEYKDVKFFTNKFATFDLFKKFGKRLTAPKEES